tara:strand:- start:716 stop:991 length:276 start_codon:yes stop_codon:yes gene_type:complete
MKPKIQTVRELDIVMVLAHFVKEDRIAQKDKDAFWKEFMNYPSNESFISFNPLDYKQYLKGKHHYSEEAVKVFNLLFDEYGYKEYQLNISW